jgi:hypothetical protein
MPLIDIRCLTCAVVSEVNRPLADCVGERPWPTPACPKCDQPTEQVHLPHALSYAPAVVVYRMADGSFRYPAASESLATRNYEREGGTRMELRGWAEVRKFESSVNAQERSRIERRIDRQLAHQEHGTSLRRSELYNRMKSMSDGAKSLGRRLIDMNDRKPKPRAYDPGFHVEAYSNNRSNREESRDERGRRRND